MTAGSDAEYPTLGGLLLAPAQLERVQRWLRPADFALPVARLTFSTILAMSTRGVPVDPVTVRAELARRGAIRADGYPGLELVRMIESVPSAGSTSYYARLVLADAIGRGVRQVGERLVQLGSTPREPGDVFSIAAEQLRVLEGLRRRWELASGEQVRVLDVPDRGLAREPVLLAAAIADLELLGPASRPASGRAVGL